MEGDMDTRSEICERERSHNDDGESTPSRKGDRAEFKVDCDGGDEYASDSDVDSLYDVGDTYVKKMK